MPSAALPSEEHLDSLRSVFDVVVVQNAEEARRRADGPGLDLFLLGARDIVSGPGSPVEGLPPAGVLSALEHIAEGVGVIGATGVMTWANASLRGHDQPTQDRFVETCRTAMEQFDQRGASVVSLHARPGRTYSFACDDSHYEVLVSIASVREADDQAVTAVVGILWEITESQKLQSKIDAIDAAGAELMRIDAATIARLNMGERLNLLEEKIIGYVRELLNFDKFEIRLTDRETNQLELVFNLGLTPLKIGEVLYAEGEDNGISGRVAATGECYICSDVLLDPYYRTGLEGAASSLTVPLRLFDRVLGVFNVESCTKNAFDDNDRRFAQIFARHIAMAMHILDLLVVERYTTNEQVAANVLGEVDEPLARITDEVARLREAAGPDGEAAGDPARALARIAEAAEGIRRRLAVFAGGPRSLLGAEQELHRGEPDPVMVGKRVILADNEPVVRDAIATLLSQKGCDVTACDGGAEIIDHLVSSRSRSGAYDLIISDIRMPDRNGYEVFQTAKECCPKTPVILITGFGYDPHHSIVRARQEGLHSFLFKPLQASQLLKAVADALTTARA